MPPHTWCPPATWRLIAQLAISTDTFDHLTDATAHPCPWYLFGIARGYAVYRPAAFPELSSRLGSARFGLRI